MKVWRVAHGTERDYINRPVGPYRNNRYSDNLREMFEEHCGLDHPSPIMDPMLSGISMGEVCGFSSKEAMRAWFAGWMATLGTLGYLAYEYEVSPEHVRVGQNGQAVFIIDKATELRRHAFDLSPVQLTIF